MAQQLRIESEESPEQEPNSDQMTDGSNNT